LSTLPPHVRLRMGHSVFQDAVDPKELSGASQTHQGVTGSHGFRSS
jgi:hypothetical protein